MHLQDIRLDGAHGASLAASKTCGGKSPILFAHGFGQTRGAWLAAIVVFWLRRTMDESLQAESIEAARTGGARASGSMRELFVNQWRPLLLCFLVTAGGTVAFYTYSVTGPKMIQSAFAGGDVITGTWINLALLAVLMLLQPVGGWLSDIVGRKSLLVFFGIGGVLYTGYLVLALPQQTSAWAAFAILGVGFVILTGYTSINAVVKAELFPAHIRALGVALPYAIANAIFGGTAEYVALAFKQNGWERGFYWDVTAMIGVSLITYWRMRDTRTHSRIVED